MLARDYSYEYEQEIEQNTRELHFAKLKKEVELDKYALARHCISVVLCILMLTYAFSVLRSTALLTSGNQLLSLQSQELELIESNKQLRLEVEQLKGPERVIGFAETQLGMSTARSNIYVYPTPGKKMNNTTYALSNK